MPEATPAVQNPDAPDAPIPAPLGVGTSGRTPPTVKPALTLADIKAQRRANPAPVPAAQPPAAPASAATPPATPTEAAKPIPGAGDAVTKTIDIDDKTLNEFVTGNRELREARQRVKELEAKQSLADKLEQANKLAQEGKHYDAIRLLGQDWFDSATREVLQVQQDPGNAEVSALRKEVDELKAARDQAGKDAQSAKEQAATEAREAGLRKVAEYVQADSKTYPVLSKSPELISMSMKGADEAYPKLVAKLGRDLTDTEKNDLIRAALAEGEDKWGKVFAPKPAAAQGSAVDSTIRGGVTTPASAAPTGPMTLEQVKALRREKAKQAGQTT